MRRDRAVLLRDIIHQASVALSDEIALKAPEFFPVWAINTAYTAGQRVRWVESLYRCEQTHTSQAGWVPGETPALWTEVANPRDIPIWRQPTGTQDAYALGDKVHYPAKDDPIWVSTLDANTWEPGVYGWEKII